MNLNKIRATTIDQLRFWTMQKKQVCYLKKKYFFCSKNIANNFHGILFKQQFLHIEY